MEEERKRLAAEAEAKRLADEAEVKRLEEERLAEEKRLREEKIMADSPRGICKRIKTICPDQQVCILRYVADISNPTASGYVTALAADPELTKGSEKYQCYYEFEKEALLATSNKKSEETTVTMAYTE